MWQEKSIKANTWLADRRLRSLEVGPKETSTERVEMEKKASDYGQRANRETPADADARDCDRREFLAKCGKYAVYATPALVALLSPSKARAQFPSFPPTPSPTAISTYP